MNQINKKFACEEFICQTKQYNKIDARLALSLYFIVLLGEIILAKLIVYYQLSSKGVQINLLSILFTGIFSFTSMSIVFLFCRLRHQSLHTIGFSKTHAGRSLLWGIVFSILLIVPKIKALRQVFLSLDVITYLPQLVILVFYYLFIIGLMEELIFRGYIGPRLFGAMKHKRISILLTAVLWSFLHTPFQAIVHQISFSEYSMIHAWSNIKIMVVSVLFYWFYAKYNSLLGPVLIHFTNNFLIMLVSNLE